MKTLEERIQKLEKMINKLVPEYWTYDPSIRGVVRQRGRPHYSHVQYGNYYANAEDAIQHGKMLRVLAKLRHKTGKGVMQYVPDADLGLLDAEDRSVLSLGWPSLKEEKSES